MENAMNKMSFGAIVPIPGVSTLGEAALGYLLEYDKELLAKHIAKMFLSSPYGAYVPTPLASVEGQTLDGSNFNVESPKEVKPVQAEMFDFDLKQIIQRYVNAPKLLTGMVLREFKARQILFISTKELLALSDVNPNTGKKFEIGSLILVVVRMNDMFQPKTDKQFPERVIEYTSGDDETQSGVRISKELLAVL